MQSNAAPFGLKKPHDTKLPLQIAYRKNNTNTTQIKTQTKLNLHLVPFQKLPLLFVPLSSSASYFQSSSPFTSSTPHPCPPRPNIVLPIVFLLFLALALTIVFLFFLLLALHQHPPTLMLAFLGVLSLHITFPPVLSSCSPCCLLPLLPLCAPSTSSNQGSYHFLKDFQGPFSVRKRALSLCLFSCSTT